MSSGWSTLHCLRENTCREAGAGENRVPVVQATKQKWNLECAHADFTRPENPATASRLNTQPTTVWT